MLLIDLNVNYIPPLNPPAQNLQEDQMSQNYFISEAIHCSALAPFPGLQNSLTIPATNSLTPTKDKYAFKMYNYVGLAEFKQQGNEARRQRGSFFIRYVWLSSAFGSVFSLSCSFLIDRALNCTAQKAPDLRREVTTRSRKPLETSTHHTPPL